MTAPTRRPAPVISATGDSWRGFMRRLRSGSIADELAAKRDRRHLVSAPAHPMARARRAYSGLGLLLRLAAAVRLLATLRAAASATLRTAPLTALSTVFLTAAALRPAELFDVAFAAAGGVGVVASSSASTSMMPLNI